MKAISRALAEAARQLELSSDTSRLDSELLMAEALHIDRDRLILSPPDRAVPKRFWDMTLRMGENLGPERMRLGVRLVGEPPRRLTPARRRLIEVLSDGLLHGKSEAAREAGVSGGVVDGLVDEGTLTVEVMPPPLAPPAPDPSFAQPEFSSQQRAAVDAMRALAANGTFHGG